MKQQLYTSISQFALRCALACSVLIGFSVSAQTYPCQTTISTSPPYLNYLSYYGDQNNHLQITVTNLDFTLPPMLARLRIRIEGAGYELFTNPNATIGQPFLVEAGIPLTISGIDLLPYLQANNLINPSGVNLDDLPHGFTTICVDVIRESASHQVLSSNNCGFLLIQEYLPPQTFTPSCGSVLDTNMMFHTFTWTPPTPFPAGVGLEVFYDFSIHQWADPNNNSALGGNSILIYQQTDLITPMTQVSDFDLTWELGRTYVWRVTARVESNGIPISLIENGGVSAPCTFVYGEVPTLADVLGDGLEIELFTQPSSERKGKAWWYVTDNTPNQGLSDFDQYFLEYRKQPTGNEGFEIPWFSETVSDTFDFIYQLEPSTTYQVKVSGVIAGTVGDPTPIETFTTPNARVYNCGEADLPFLPNTYTVLENATVGTQVKIGQFMMTMTEVVPLGSAGHYAGKGEIPIPFLANARAKVRFDDILIDTEYLVHEGRADVITEGLTNWLDEQYQQFIDPYFVDGTIDSAYVLDSVAWVVVDGVAQPFYFDPPNYPIIVNDASGNQYTIYPNGDIVIGTYLSVSETWAVTANETVRFGQNANEERGFDPMEHMEWYENYETMQLSDNSFYYVANKSMAKNETDKVNVQFPPNVTAMSFQLADGTPIGVVDLDGAWDGNKPYLDTAIVKTLNLPSFSSSGKYEVHAFANNEKVGQLNIHVYNQKNKEVIVVPIASISSVGLSETNIQNELKRTLGEANINVTVTLSPPWSNSTFTPTTNIALPTEVGVLSKYSDDMRALRDAYFDENPTAPKNKYYVFLVNGFDDPSQLGYMVRGRSMGFVMVSSQAQVLQTISHELGHGMGALEHTFKDNGIAQGSTNNLMDYSGETNLTIAQWKELRDLDIAPSIWDDSEDAASYSVGIAFLEPLMDSSNTFTFLRCNGQFITLPANIKSVKFSSLDRSIDQLTHSENDVFAPVGSIIAFIDSANVSYTSDEMGRFKIWENGSWGEPYLLDTLTKFYHPTSAITSMFVPTDGTIFEKYFRVPSPIGQVTYDLTPSSALEKIIIFETSDLTKRNLDGFDFVMQHALLNYGILDRVNTDFDFSNEKSPIIISNGDSLTLMNLNSQSLFVMMANHLLTVKNWMYYLAIVNLKGNEFNGFANCLDSQVQNAVNEQENAPNEQTDLLDATTTPSSTIIPITDLQPAFENLPPIEFSTLSQLAIGLEDLTDIVLRTAIEQYFLNNNPAQIALIKQSIANDIPYLVAQKIDFASECLLYSLTGAERIAAVDKLSDDSYWYLIPRILRNIPENERSTQEVMIVNAFRVNNYQRLRTFIPQISEWFDFSDQPEVPILSDIMSILSEYAGKHQANYPESTTSETVTFVSNSVPGQIPYAYNLEIPHVGIPITVGADGAADIEIGMVKNVALSGNSINFFNIKTGSNHPKFPLRLKSNGKIEVIQHFSIYEGSTVPNLQQTYSYGNPVTNNEYIYQINTMYEIDPMDIVDIVIGAQYGVAGYDEGRVIRVPAMGALLIQQNIDNADFNYAVRDLVNGIEVGMGILALATVPMSGGTSLATYLEVTAGIAGALDQVLLQQEYSMSTQELADAEYLKDWQKIKLAIDLTVAGTSLATAGSSIFSAGSSIGNNAVALTTTGKSLRGSGHLSLALTMKRSMRLTNTADNFTSPFLIQKSQAIRASLRTGIAIVSTGNAGVTGIAVIDDFLALSPKIDLLTQADLPSGYLRITLNNSHYIRRVNASNPNTPRLMVDQTGTIVPYVQHQRLASNNLLRTRLIQANGGVTPPNHQGHHIVPDNVAQNSPIHMEAINRGLYDIDRESNGKLLAESDEDYIPGFYSEAYPTHFGSHPQYDIQVANAIDDIVISEGIDLNNLQNLTNAQLTDIIDDIEMEALDILENWFPSKLN